MKGFRRAQLRGSDELFRQTDEPEATQEVMAVDVPAQVHAVPAAPAPDQRSVRLTHEEIALLADAVQHLKFPNPQAPRPSMERFEQLDHIRQKLLESI